MTGNGRTTKDEESLIILVMMDQNLLVNFMMIGWRETASGIIMMVSFIVRII